MDYNYKAIGKRIRKERLEAGFRSQGKFAQELGLAEESRQTIGNWENGKYLPDLDFLITMCRIFNCELGYLLCEYDCKTRETTDIREVTGLSEKAINKLTMIKNLPIHDILITLSKILEHDDCIDLLLAVHSHVWDFNKKRFRINSEDSKYITDMLNCRHIDIRKYMEASSKSLLESSFIKIIEDIK